jgi:hypothetical protein
MLSEYSGNDEFAHSFRKRHYGGESHAWCAANENSDGQRLSTGKGFRMMSRNAAMNLIMKSRLIIQQIIIAGNLNAVHSEIGSTESGTAHRLRIDLRQCQIGTAISLP